MGQAMESLHPADGVFHGNAGSRMLPVMFDLRGGQFRLRVVFRFLRPFVWKVYLGFHAIIFLRTLEPKVEPQIHSMEPFQFWVEYLFHELVVVDAAGEDAEEEKDFPVQGREDERLERVAFFFR